MLLTFILEHFVKLIAISVCLCADSYISRFDGFTSTFQDKLFKGYDMEIHNQIFYTTTCSCLLSLTGNYSSHSELYFLWFIFPLMFVTFSRNNCNVLHAALYIVEGTRDDKPYLVICLFVFYFETLVGGSMEVFLSMHFMLCGNVYLV